MFKNLLIIVAAVCGSAQAADVVWNDPNLDNMSGAATYVLDPSITYYTTNPSLVGQSNFVSAEPGTQVHIDIFVTSAQSQFGISLPRRMTDMYLDFNNSVLRSGLYLSTATRTTWANIQDVDTTGGHVSNSSSIIRTFTGPFVALTFENCHANVLIEIQETSVFGSSKSYFDLSLSVIACEFGRLSKGRSSINGGAFFRDSGTLTIVDSFLASGLGQDNYGLIVSSTSGWDLVFECVSARDVFGTISSWQGNFVESSCNSSCKQADVNKDGVINFNDNLLVQSLWGLDYYGDPSNNGVMDFSDTLLINSSWGCTWSN